MRAHQKPLMKSLEDVRQWVEEAFRTESEAELLALKIVINTQEVGAVKLTYEIPLLRANLKATEAFLGAIASLESVVKLNRDMVTSAVVSMGNSICDLGVTDGC